MLQFVGWFLQGPQRLSGGKAGYRADRHDLQE